MLHPPLGSRAIFYVLFVDMDIIQGLLFGQVREPGAINGPDLVYGALKVYLIEKLARSFGVHPITFPVLIKPFLPESIRGHIQKRGDAFYISGREGGSHAPATVTAIQTLNFLPGLLICYLSHFLESPGWGFFQFSEEPAQARFFIEQLLPESPKIHVWKL
jgi:hypothetical protein